MKSTSGRLRGWWERASGAEYEQKIIGLGSRPIVAIECALPDLWLLASALTQDLMWQSKEAKKWTPLHSKNIFNY